MLVLGKDAQLVLAALLKEFRFPKIRRGVPFSGAPKSGLEDFWVHIGIDLFMETTKISQPRSSEVRVNASTEKAL